MGFSRQEYWSGCHRLLRVFTIHKLKMHNADKGTWVFLIVLLVHLWNLFNVVLISAIRQSDSVIHTHTHTHTHISFFKFFSIMVYPGILNIVPCAIQEDPVVYLHLSLKKTKNTMWTIPSTFPFQKHTSDISTEARGMNPLFLKSDPLPDALNLRFPPAQSEARALGWIPVPQPGPYAYTPGTLKAWSCTSGSSIAWNSVGSAVSGLSLRAQWSLGVTVTSQWLHLCSMGEKATKGNLSNNNFI